MLMICFDPIQTAHALNYVLVADAIDCILAKMRSEQAYAPERIVMPTSELDSLLVMPAYDDDWIVTKLVTVHRNNFLLGMPMIQGEVILMRKIDGCRVLQLDGATVTAFRTAALSLVAIRKMGFGDAKSFVVVGSGTQARAHVEALFSMFPACKIKLFARNAISIGDFIRDWQQRQFQISLADELHEAVHQCDVVVTATSSSQPVIPESMISVSNRGQLIVAVGAYRKDMAEVPKSIVQNASSIVVDTLAGAKREAGDLIQAGVDWANVVELASRGEVDRRPDGISIFKSVGNALWDLAAARSAYQSLSTPSSLSQPW